jgi:putative endonuclease
VTAARQRLGRDGEARAAAWYVARGYDVLATNWRCAQGELDLIVGRAGTVVFSEVKARTSDRFGTPAEAVTPAKQARIRRLAAQWLAEAVPRRARVRFDVAAVCDGHVEVLEDAF